MINLHSLRLQNTFLFKDVTFFFNRNGVSLIHGLNLSGNTKKNSNGVGKSTLFAHIPELIFGEPLIGSRLDRTRKGKITMKLTKDEGKKKVQYVIVQEFKGGEKLRVYQDGKDLEIHTLPATRSYIKDTIFGITDEEFQTLIHLDDRAAHPLVMGDTGARRRFFTSFFRLNSVDGMRKLVASHISEIRSQKLLFNELLSNHREKKAALLTDADIEIRKVKLSKAERFVKKSSTYLDRINRARTTLEVRGNPMYKRLRTLCEQDFSTFEALLSFTRNDHSAAKLRVRIARRWSEAKVKRKEYARQAQVIIKRTKELWGSDDVPSASEVKARAKKYERVRDLLEECRSSIIQANTRLANYQSRIDDHLVRIDHLDDEIKDLRKTSKCPTCGQKVEASTDVHLISSVSKLNKRKDELEKEMETFKEKVRVYRLRIKEQEEQRARHEKRMEILERYKKAAALLERMPEKPEPFEGERLDEDDEYAKYEKLNSKLEFLKSCEGMIEGFRRAEALSDEEIALAKIDTEELNTRVSNAHSVIGRIKYELENQETLQAEVRELKGRLRTMKESIDEEEAYVLLESAFSQKGMKAIMIRSICSRLEQVVNKYAKLVFPEDFRFEFDLDKQFHIIVHRRYGKTVKSSDVRKLSGAEYKLFCLLLQVALTTFVPASKRWNVLILDEPSAKMSPQLQESFSKFLPVLNKVVPHIIVITPKTQDVYEKAKVFTVVKKRGVSSIVEGSVAEV